MSSFKRDSTRTRISALKRVVIFGWTAVVAAYSFMLRSVAPAPFSVEVLSVQKRQQHHPLQSWNNIPVGRLRDWLCDLPQAQGDGLILCGDNIEFKLRCGWWCLPNTGATDLKIKLLIVENILNVWMVWSLEHNHASCSPVCSSQSLV